MHKSTHKKFNVYFYSSGTHLSLHECITRHTDRASQYASECVCSWRSENNVTPKGSHLSSFSPSSRIHSFLLCACRDFPFQFRRDVRPVPPSLTEAGLCPIFTKHLWNSPNQLHFKISEGEAQHSYNWINVLNWHLIIFNLVGQVRSCSKY